MNGRATFADELGLSGAFLRRTIRERKTMTSAMTAFAIAVGATSLVCYALMTRLQSRKRDRRSPRGGSAPDAANLAGANLAGDASSPSNWFGGGHSGFDGSGNPVDSGGFHGGGGDFGGGGGGG